MCNIGQSNGMRSEDELNKLIRTMPEDKLDRLIGDIAGLGRKSRYPEVDSTAAAVLRLKSLSYKCAVGEKQTNAIKEDLRKMLRKYGFNGDLLFKKLDANRKERGYPEMNETVASEFDTLIYRCANARSADSKVAYADRLEEKLKEHGFYSDGIVEVLVLGAINSETAAYGADKGLKGLF